MVSNKLQLAVEKVQPVIKNSALWINAAAQKRKKKSHLNIGVSDLT